MPDFVQTEADGVRKSEALQWFELIEKSEVIRPAEV
jgi:hypothetical protein